VPLLPLYGHVPLRERLAAAIKRGRLPASLLLEGPRGVGKQQLALWAARILVCDNAERAPCGECQSCRFARALAHPDIHWFFPRPRPEGGDADPDEVRADIADAIAERLEANGLYEPPSGDEGIFINTVRVIVQSAAMSPAMSRRKVFVIGDAERMVPQTGADYAANALLKLLEEPLADTTLILTSSEPGALLPTIRSRVVSVRVPRLSDEDVRAFLEDRVVCAHLGADAARADDLVRLAGGAPGRLLARRELLEALGRARRLLEAAASDDRGMLFSVALSQGFSRARGAFSDTLDALTTLLRDRVEQGTTRALGYQAAGAARAIAAVEEAKEQAEGNVNPQLITASLLSRLSPLLR